MTGIHMCLHVKLYLARWTTQIHCWITILEFEEEKMVGDILIFLPITQVSIPIDAQKKIMVFEQSQCCLLANLIRVSYQRHICIAINFAILDLFYKKLVVKWTEYASWPNLDDGEEKWITERRKGRRKDRALQGKAKNIFSKLLVFFFIYD